MRKTHFGMMLVGVFVGMVVGAALVVLQMKYGTGPGATSTVCSPSYMDEPKPLGADNGTVSTPQTTAFPALEGKSPEDVKAAPCARQTEAKPAPVEPPGPPRDTSIWIGHLRKAGFTIDGKPGFALEDSDQHLLLYTTAEKELDLTPLVGQEVVLTGWSGHRDDLRGEYLVTRKAVTADSDPEPTTSVAAAPRLPHTVDAPTPPAADLPASREEVYQRLFKFMMDHAADGKVIEKKPAASADEPSHTPEPTQVTSVPAPVPDAVPEKVTPSMEWRKSWGNELATAPAPRTLDHSPQYIPPTPDSPLTRELAQMQDGGIGAVAPALPEPIAPLPAKPKVRSWPATGTYTCEMCPESHLTLPEDVTDLPGTLYIGPGADGCLYICNGPQLKKVLAQEDSELASPDQRRRLRRTIFSQLEKVILDADGTLELSPRMMEYAGLKEKMVVIGAGDHYELWDAGRWAKYSDSEQAEAGADDDDVPMDEGLVVKQPKARVGFASKVKDWMIYLLPNSDDLRRLEAEWECIWSCEKPANVNPCQGHDE